MDLRRIGFIVLALAIFTGVTGIIVAVYLKWSEPEVAITVTEIEIRATERAVESKDIQVEQEEIIR